MKKILYSALFLYGFVSVGFAQTRMTVGLRTGVNVASYKFDFGTTPAGFSSPISNVTLFSIGVPLEIAFNSHFALQAELNFIQKGFSSKTDFSGQGFTLKSEGAMTVNWLEIPILAKAKFGAPDGFGGGIFFGPSIGYGLSGRSKGTSATVINGVANTTSTDEALNFKEDEHSRVDVGLNFGGEVHYGGIFLDVRYQLGLTNMVTDKSTITAGSGQSVSARTRGLGITVGYRIPIGIGTVKEVKKSKK